MRPAQITKIFFGLMPLLEIAGFIVVGRWLGIFLTLLLIVLTTVLGFGIMRNMGFKNMMDMQRKMTSGQIPPANMLDNSFTMFGAFLLLMPGFITDTIGLILVTPPIKRAIIKWLIRKGMAPPPPTRKHHVIEGEFHRHDGQE